MKMIYFRHVDIITYKDANGKDILFDTSRLSLKDRLIISAFATKISLGTKKTLAEIIFDYDKDRVFTPANFKAFDELITDIIKKKYIGLINWIETNYSKNSTYKRRFTDTIDASEIYDTKNGRSGYSIDSIAWKAFVLASADNQQIRIDSLNKILTIKWLNSDLIDISEVGEEELKRYKVNKTQTQRTIQRWLDAAGIDGEFKGDYFYIKGRKNKKKEDNDASKKEDEMKSMPNKITKAEEKAILSTPSDTNLFSILKSKDKEEAKEEAKEAKDEEESTAQPDAPECDEAVTTDTTIKEEPIAQLDAPDVTEEEDPEWYIQYYDDYCEHRFGDELNKKTEYARKLYKMWGNTVEKIEKICRKLKITPREYESYKLKGFIPGNDGLIKKAKIKAALSELRCKVMNAPFDNSWMPGFNAESVKHHGKCLIGLSFKNSPELKNAF